MIEPEIILNLILAGGLGAIVGLERTYSRKQVGVREYVALSVAGAVASSIGGPVVLAVGVAAVGVAILFSIRLAFRGRAFFGPTTAASMFLMFLIGALAGSGRPTAAIVISLVLTMVLLERQPIHSVTDRMTPEEVKSALEFGAIAAILYPIAPDHTIDPWGYINPKLVLLVVVLVSSINFTNLVIMRIFGAGGRALEVSGLFGGLVHSEATTGAIANRFKENPLLLPSAIVGILLANSTMLLRNALIALIISPNLLPLLAIPFLVMVVSGIGQALIRSRKSTGRIHEIEIDLSSPFAVGPALKFGAIFLCLIVLAELANRYLGYLGVYAIAVFGGFAYAGAITASVATLTYTGELSTSSAAIAIVLTSAVAFLNKPLWVRMTGAKWLARGLLRPTVITALLGVLVLAIQFL